MKKEDNPTLESEDTGIERLLTPKDISEKLQIRLSTIYHWVKMRKIPFLRIGKHIRFRSSDIARWIEEQCQEKINLRTRFF